MKPAVSFIVAGAWVAGWGLTGVFAGAPAATAAQTSDANNGARICFNAVSDRDSAVSYTGGPDFGGMMMGMMNARLTCAACHGPEGRGGIHAMHIYVMKAPDIRYEALNAMPEMRQRARRYDLSDFRTAVTEGKHPDGETLSRDMPRWQMSDADLQDLFAFVQRLPQ